MDFVAEILLGYADTQLTEKIDYQKITDYQILRYRDDYRIFVNSTQEGDRILKCLTEVMMDLGLQLSSAKTNLSSEVVQSSIKGRETQLDIIKNRTKGTYKNTF